MPVAYFWVDVASDPVVVVSSYDAKGVRRWRKAGGVEVYRKMVREHAPDAPIEADEFALEPAMDFVLSRWRRAGGPTATGWAYVPPPPEVAPPAAFTPNHEEETVVAFGGRGERLEALILDALGAKAWAIHRLAPNATLLRVFGPPTEAALPPAVRRRVKAPAVVYRVDLKRQLVTWNDGSLDLAAATSTSMQPVPFDWQAILERRELRGRARWVFRTVRPDVLELEAAHRGVTGKTAKRPARARRRRRA